MAKKLGYAHTMPFGKFKGQTIKDIARHNIEYLMWIRQEKIKSEQLEFFDAEVTKYLCDKIAGNEKAFGRYKMELKGAKTHIEGLTTEPDRSQAYDGQWGSF